MIDLYVTPDSFGRSIKVMISVRKEITHHVFQRGLLVLQQNWLTVKMVSQHWSCASNQVYLPPGQCVCNDCFMINDSTGGCRLCSDYSYRSNRSECGTDNRPSQLTAFLLSLFLSATGAANFYIGRNDLGTISSSAIAVPKINRYHIYIFSWWSTIYTYSVICSELCHVLFASVFGLLP